MKFFIPAARDAAQTEELYEGTQKFVSEEMGAKLSDRQVYRIRGIHNGKEFEAKVGERFESQGELVIVILFDTERNLYYVCTTNRGVARGMPYLVGGGEARSVEDFE